MIKINIGMIFQSSFQYCPTINFPHGRRPNQSMISKNAFSICISTWKHLTKTFLQQMHCCKMFLYPRGKMEEKQKKLCSDIYQNFHIFRVKFKPGYTLNLLPKHIVFFSINFFCNSLINYWSPNIFVLIFCLQIFPHSLFFLPFPISAISNCLTRMDLKLLMLPDTDKWGKEEGHP